MLPVGTGVKDRDHHGGVTPGGVPGDVGKDLTGTGHGGAGFVETPTTEVPLPIEQRVVDGGEGLELAAQVGLGGDDTRQGVHSDGGADGVKGKGSAHAQARGVRHSGADHVGAGDGGGDLREHLVELAGCRGDHEPVIRKRAAGSDAVDAHGPTAKGGPQMPLHALIEKTREGCRLRRLQGSTELHSHQGGIELPGGNDAGLRAGNLGDQLIDEVGDGGGVFGPRHAHREEVEAAAGDDGSGAAGIGGPPRAVAEAAQGVGAGRPGGENNSGEEEKSCGQAGQTHCNPYARTTGGADHGTAPQAPGRRRQFPHHSQLSLDEAAQIRGVRDVIAVRTPVSNTVDAGVRFVSEAGERSGR